MSIIFIVLGGAAIFYVAYITYGKFVAKNVFELDDKRITPAVEMEDGLDYVPTDSKFLLGQHFSAIAAAGPVTGPILAGIAFGWVPALIWIVLGSIFVGGVHDMGALVASIRNKGRSITETVRMNVSRSAWVLFNLFIFFALILIIVAFADITASSFTNVIELGNGEKVGGGAIASSSIMYLILPIIMGLLLRYTKLSLNWATIIFLPLVAIAIWAGKYIPINMPEVAGLAPQKVWNLLIMVYCIIAGVVPVWALLQPRGHLGGYFLYASVIVAAIGVLFGGFTVQYPAFTKPFGEGFWTPMLPMLFITIACGACSGFHSLVGSGTTSKQIKKESDTKLIGYGAMLMEGVVALIALSCVMILTKDSELLKKSPNFVYASGIGSFMQLIGVSPAFGISFGLMAFTTFVYDTLDICVRLGRFIVCELTGWKSLWGKILGTLIVGGVPVWMMTVNLTDAAGKPVAAWSVFWKTFGASNQLLAALALIGITIWLVNTAKNKKAWLYTFVPAVLMFIMSTWALINMFIANTTDAKTGAWVGIPAGANAIVPLTCVVYVVLAVWMAVETVRAVGKAKKGGPAGKAAAEAA